MREDGISHTSEDSNGRSSKGRKAKYLSEDANRCKRCLKECGGKGTKEVSCDCLALGGHLIFVIMILKVSALQYLSLASFCFISVGGK